MNATTYDRFGSPQEIVAGVINGVQPTLRAVLDNGAEIIGTHPHRVLTVDSHLDFTWKHLDQLLPGDIAVRRVGDNLWSSEEFDLPQTATIRIDGNNGNLNSITTPKTATKDFGLFLGMLMSDGSILENGVSLTSVDDAIIAKFTSLVMSLFGLPSKTEPDKRSGVKGTVVNSRLLSRWLLSVGVPRYHDDNQIPDCILQSPASIIDAFIQGYTLDGYFAEDSQWVHLCTTTSRRMAKDLASVLWNRGFDAYLGRNDGRPYHFTETNQENEQDQYVVYIGKEGSVKFLKEVGFLEERKNVAALCSLETFFPYCHKANSVSAVRVQNYYKEHRSEYKSERLRCIMKAKSTKISIAVLREFFASVDFVSPLMDPNFRFTEVKLVEEWVEVPTFDLTIDVSHEYAANSVVVHNTLKYKPNVVSFEGFTEMILKYQSQVRCCSVMPQEDQGAYEYLPEEPITEAQYLALKADLAQSVYKKAEVQEEIGREHVGCDSGACPVDFFSGSK